MRRGVWGTTFDYGNALCTGATNGQDCLLLRRHVSARKTNRLDEVSVGAVELLLDRIEKFFQNVCVHRNLRENGTLGTADMKRIVILGPQLIL